MPEVKSMFREVLPKQVTLDALKYRQHIPVSRRNTSKHCQVFADRCYVPSGQLSMEDVPTMVLCKPKLMPLKSVTLEKLEKMQLEAQEAIKQQDLALKEQQETQ
uniref:BBSome-interacting protein 1 n=1 Tax=Oncorhynchus tshawytscha TaxID=74940 RepID=A0AAZ3NRD8_ONCTS